MTCTAARWAGFLVAAIAAVIALAAPGGAAAQERPRVLAVSFDGTVNPVTKDYIVDAIRRGERDGYAAVVLLVDTPGGLDSSMRDIVQAELDARVPVVLYVYPPGARAASAGVFLAMAADVAAMAPQTNIGSSTPVSAGGGDLSDDERRKVVNDAAAYIRSLAEEHGRNADWAESAVRRAANLPAREALSQNVVDVVAEDVPSLLRAIDGRTTQPKGLELHTAGADVETIHMSLWKRILDRAIDPNIVVLLLSLGALGILIELWNPGLVLPGSVGAISLIVGLYGLQVLPVSWAGILLMLLALGFFVAEAMVASFGALALAGAVSFFFGALMLFDPAGDAFQVSIPVALAIAGTLALVVSVALAKAARLRRTAPVTGIQRLVGMEGVVREPLAPTGFVLVNGELWRAQTTDGELDRGEPVLVEGVDDREFILRVRPARDRSAASSS